MAVDGSVSLAFLPAVLDVALMIAGADDARGRLAIEHLQVVDRNADAFRAGQWLGVALEIGVQQRGYAMLSLVGGSSPAFFEKEGREDLLSLSDICLAS